MLRIVAGFEQASAGEVLMCGKPVDGPGPSRGMVFQDYTLFPHMTVLANMMLAPVKLKRMSKAQARETALTLLDRVGLRHKADSYPSELSGGQQQRVAIVRALAMKPKLLLFDEPTSALDPETVNDVLNVMKVLAQEGMTMIVVTHEMGFARSVAQQVLFMDEGRVVESGEPGRVFEAPESERLQRFLSQVL